MRLMPENDPAVRNSDDLELVERCVEGDLSAFDTLVSRYQDRVYSYACRMLGDPETARETTQDIFIRAYRYIKTFRGDSSFKTWLFTIVTSTCKNAKSYHGVRAHHRASETTVEDSGDPSLSLVDQIPDEATRTDDIAERRDLQKTVVDAVSELPEHYRKVMVLKDINDCSYEETAQILGCNIGTVKSRLARARLLVREKLTCAGIMGSQEYES